ncbi:MAG: hypothetical protein HYY15_04395 [Candidatus Omnitrophica bacterium]|nr:hypothetical protein [Candidatus Omnitrophota bacterium]
MREIIVRNLTSPNLLNRDCRVMETLRQGEASTTVVRRCTYHVASRITVPSTTDSIHWAQTLDPPPERQVYVTKDLDPDTGREQVSYKVLGSFYVVLDREIFCVNFRHILSMAVAPTASSCEE